MMLEVYDGCIEEYHQYKSLRIPETKICEEMSTFILFSKA